MICPECLGYGWRPYFVETVEGEEERAWELCLECGGGDAFPLEGAPPDRRERILRTLLNKSDKVLRLILLLLAEGRGDDYEAMREIRRWLEGNEGSGGTRMVTSGIPLFEEMVLTLGRDGENLERVARLLEDLRKTEDGRRLIPEGLEEIWEPIWAAHQRSKR